MTSNAGKRRPTGLRKARPQAAVPRQVTWLESRHARLRPVEPGDIPLIRRCLKKPPVTLWPWLIANRAKTLNRGWLARFALDSNNPALVIENRAGRARGIIALRAEVTRATLVLASADGGFWREACAPQAVALMARAAFRVLPLRRIELTVFSGSPEALRCARKAGFRQEGVLRCCRRSQRTFEDCIVMSVVRV